HHWEAAGDAIEAARWYRRAAGRTGLADLAGAIADWRKVRSLLAGAPETPETIALRIQAAMRLLTLGWRRGLSLDEAATIFEDGMALARRAGDARSPVGLLNSYGMVRGFAGDVSGAVACVTEATRLADGVDDPGLQLGARTSLVEALVMAGDHRAALARIEESLVKIAPRRPS